MTLDTFVILHIWVYVHVFFHPKAFVGLEKVWKTPDADPWGGKEVIIPPLKESKKKIIKVSNYQTVERDFNTHKSYF
jgi:hypothetical protein